MIEFPCRCGRYTFSVPMEMAGDPIQCPECRRLVDVPLHSELSAFERDGSIKIGEQPDVARDAHGIEKTMLAFTRERFNADGSEIDMRPTFDDVLDAHDPAIPRALPVEEPPDDIGEVLIAELAEPEVDKPKYDPVTGALIETIDIKPDDATPSRPHPAWKAATSRVLSYAQDPTLQPGRLRSVPRRLLHPVNLMVMGIILIVHVLVVPINVMMLAGLYLVAPLWIMAGMFFLSYYSAVIEEVGPGDLDELPRPMRDFSFSEDIWRPFTHSGGAIMICYLPASIAHVALAPFAVVAGLAIIGTFFLPAVVLTLSTSGSAVNLRPDRVMGVISAIGIRYFALVLLLAGAMMAYYLGLWRMEVDLLLQFTDASSASMLRDDFAWWFSSAVTYPALLVGLFGMNVFCYSLGLIYRRCQPEFPWILQHHVSTKLAERNRPSKPRNLNANSLAAWARMAEPLAPPKLPR